MKELILSPEASGNVNPTRFHTEFENNGLQGKAFMNRLSKFALGCWLTDGKEMNTKNNRQHNYDTWT